MHTKFLHFFCLAALLAVAAKSDSMDGTKWKVKVTPDQASAGKGAKGFDDEFFFASGQFTSTAMQAQGFQSGPYRFETEEGEVEWSADKATSTGDMAGWGGRVDGSTTTGNFHWQKEDGTSLFYKFTGKKE
jgi:hypothetical protein